MSGSAARGRSWWGRFAKTVLHEIGHYFGFDDDYLHAHGY